MFKFLSKLFGLKPAPVEVKLSDRVEATTEPIVTESVTTTPLSTGAGAPSEAWPFPTTTRPADATKGEWPFPAEAVAKKGTKKATKKTKSVSRSKGYSKPVIKKK